MSETTTDAMSTDAASTDAMSTDAASTEQGERAGRTAGDLDVATLAQANNAHPDRAEVLEALKDVVDPELGINIVDLGLVYDVVIDSSNTATLDMTLTSAACPLTEMIEDQVKAVLTGDGLVDDFRINWVWMPPWDLTHITEDGRDQLRALGFSI